MSSIGLLSCLPNEILELCLALVAVPHLVKCERVSVFAFQFIRWKRESLRKLHACISFIEGDKKCSLHSKASEASVEDEEGCAFSVVFNEMPAQLNPTGKLIRHNTDAASFTQAILEFTASIRRNFTAFYGLEFANVEALESLELLKEFPSVYDFGLRYLDGEEKNDQKTVSSVFFKHQALKQLQALTFHGFSFTLELGDDELLGLDNIMFWQLEAKQVLLTHEGVQKILLMWHRGEAALQNFYIQSKFQDSSLSKDQFWQPLHPRCNVKCTRRRLHVHCLVNAGESEEAGCILHITSTGYTQVDFRVRK